MLRLFLTSNEQKKKKDNKYLKNIEISEAYITIEEWNEILLKLAI